MEKSIEEIWSEGFLDNNALIAPRINNLYNQKSQLLIEKFKRIIKMDQISILPLGVLLMIGFSIWESVLLGGYVLILVIALFVLNQSKLKALNKIDCLANSYQYLSEFKKYFKSTIAYYTKLIGLGMPLTILPVYWYLFQNSDKYEQIIAKFHWAFIVFVFAGLGIFLALMGIAVVKMSSKIMYGSLLNMLDELIADMDELQKEL
jgi:hypothetical protein